MADKGTHACCTANRGQLGHAGIAATTAAVAERPPQRSTRPQAATHDGRDGMLFIPGGEFLMGTDDKEGFPADGEGPIRRVTVKPFLMDRTVVTNAQFAE